jgi:hypothetical protein
MLSTLSDRTRLLLELNAPRPDQPVHEDPSRGLRGQQRILQSLYKGNEDIAAS